MNERGVKFSLVLCTVGRRDEVAAFCESLLRQNRDDYELILVDQNPDGLLDGVAAVYATKLPLRHIKSATRGLSRARNVGLQYADGELIGFPDDDCEYFDRYLDRVAELFDADASLGGLTGYPTPAATRTLGHDWNAKPMTLSRLGVLNRCQEFTIFVRRSAMRGVRFNEQLGVGAGTLWGADEGPDFLIRVVEHGAKVVFYPHLYVYHPEKQSKLTPAIITRAASYARGRGALFRIHRFPLTTAANAVFRSVGGVVVYLLKLQPRRAKYYAAVCGGLLRGLLMRPDELSALRHVEDDAAVTEDGPVVVEAGRMPEIDPIVLSPLALVPLVSVLVANYNYAQFLPAMLDSLLGQTYTNWEAVVVDDGSTDGSADVVRRYAARDARIRLIEQPNAGQNAAVNACYRELRGDVICLLDSDDVFYPTKIANVVAALRQRPDCGVVTHFAAVIDADGKPLPATLNSKLDSGWLAPTAFERGGCVYVPTTSCMSFRREVMDQLMPMPPEQRRDADGYLGMAAQFLSPFVTIGEKLAGYRVHGSNMGGLTEPTPKRLQYELSLILGRTKTLTAFVAARFGEGVSRRLHVEDNPQFLQAALKFAAIGGRDAEFDIGDARKLANRHPDAKWRLLWQAIFTLPGPVRRRLLPALHRSHKLKAAVRRWLPRPAGVA